MAQFGFYYDNTRCTGCKTCVMACKDYYDVPLDVAYRKVYDIEGGNWAEGSGGTLTTDCFFYHLSSACNHCDDPACVKFCPTTAMHKDETDGIVKVDTTKCIGCGYCVMACPYDAPKVDREAGHAVKCEGCADRVTQGLAPVCVSACPLRALDAGDIDELRARYGNVAQIYPMPSPDMTHPNVTIKPSPASKLPEVNSSKITNPKEV